MNPPTCLLAGLMIYTLRGSCLRVLAVAITAVQDYFLRIDE